MSTRTAAILCTVVLAVGTTTAAQAVPCVAGAVSDRCPSWSAIATADANSTDTAVDIVATGSHVVVLGTQNNPATSSADLMLVSYAPADGSPAWSTYLGGAARDTGIDLVAGDGVLYVVGTTGPDGARDVLLAAVAADSGEVLWTRSIGTAVIDDVAAGVVVGSDGGAILGMTTVHPASGGRPVVASYTPDGQLGWQRELATVGDQPLVAVAAAGGDVVALSDHPFGGRLAALSAADGTPRWAAEVEGDPVTLAASEDLVVAVAQSAGADADWLVNGYAAETGQAGWADVISGATATGDGADVPAAVAFAPGGEHVAVVGATVGVSSSDMATVVYDAASGDRWRADFAGITSRHDRATAVAFDVEGEVVYVTGETGRVGAGAGAFSGTNDLGYAAHDVTTLAYDVTTGGQLWVAHHDGPRGYTDDGVAVAATAGGAFVVANTWSENQPNAGIPVLQSTGRDITTLAYLGP